MKLCLINHSYKYELEKLIRIFLPFEKIEFCDNKAEGERVCVTSICRNGTKTLLSAELLIDNKRFSFSETVSNENADYDKECERLLAVSLYNCFVSASYYTPSSVSLSCTAILSLVIVINMCRTTTATEAILVILVS